MPQHGQFKLQFRINRFARYAARYSYEDDRLQREIGVAAHHRGRYARAEFVEIRRWKTPRSAPLVAQNTAAEVKAATRIALAPDTEDRERMRALQSLRGVNWATASVLFHLAYPERYPIWDVRALQALGINGRFTPSYKRWSAYVANYRELLVRAGLDGRTLDKGLWQWSVENKSPLGR
ncbi:MAG: hypothetical protein ACTHQQ_16425 [Solirubrobacteraceae bacterium]